MPFNGLKPGKTAYFTKMGRFRQIIMDMATPKVLQMNDLNQIIVCVVMGKLKSY